MNQYNDYRNADIGTASLLLHHSVLSHLTHSRSTDTPKKTLLLLYLLRYRYILRYQLTTLLGYSEESSRGADELVNRLCRGKLAKKVAAGESSSYDCYSITTAGMDAAATLFKSEVTNLIQGSISFAKRCASLLAEYSCTLDECLDELRIQCGKKRKNLTTHTHLLAMEDCYISLLHLIPPDCFPTVQYEVTYSDGLPVSQREQLLIKRYRATDVRTDAVLTLSLPKVDASPVDVSPTAYQRILVEQDTGSQMAMVITDKLNRYRDHIISQWLSTKEDPPLLLFSLLTSHQESDAGLEKCSTKGIYYAAGIVLLAEVYSMERSVLPATVTLGVLEQYLASLPSHATTGKDYLVFLREQIKRFGSSLSAMELREAYTGRKNKKAADKDTYSKYISRRTTIFNSAERSTGWLPMFLRGVSLGTIPNSHTSSLLALYPVYCSFGDVLSRIPSSSGCNCVKSYNAFTTFQLETPVPGTEIQSITMRNCFSMVDGTVYAVENISDDYGGYMRAVTLLKKGGRLPCSLVLLIRMKDIKTVLPLIKEAAGQRVNESVYICHYSVGGSEAPVFNTPIRLSRI